MSSFNRVTLLGNLARDPEIRTTKAGMVICNVTVATSERWKDRESGEMKEVSEFTNVAIFNENISKVVEKYCRKGSKVLVDGKLKTRKWQDDEGKDRYTTEVVIDKFNGQLVLAGSKGDGEARGEPAARGGRDDAKGGAAYGSERDRGFSGGGNKPAPRGGGRPDLTALEDDIPFAPEWRV